MPINTEVSAGLYITLPKEAKEKLKKYAAQHQRSMSKEPAYVIIQYVEELERKENE